MADGGGSLLGGIFDDFSKKVYEAKGKGQKIDRGLYQETARQMTDALAKGLGSKEFSFDSPMNAVALKLRTNLYAFSAAKSLTEYRAFAAALLDADGNIKSFSQFRKDIEKLNVMYNETWLKTEYDTAIAQAQAAARWDDQIANAGILDQLRYKTQEDDKVRPTHAALDDLVASIFDEIWDTIYPPCDWECRCFTLAENGSDPTAKEMVIELMKAAKIPPLFKNNPGKTGVVYGKSHPYYQSVKGKLTELDAVKNYGMRNYPNVLADNEAFAPELPSGKNIQDYNRWWDGMVQKYGVGEDSFVIKDLQGNKMLFNADPKGRKGNFFREHVKNRPYAYLADQVIQHPDEAWIYHPNVGSSEISNVYVKYYKNKILVLFSRLKGTVLEAETIYEVTNEKTFNNLRKGLLMHAPKKI